MGNCCPPSKNNVNGDLRDDRNGNDNTSTSPSSNGNDRKKKQNPNYNPFKDNSIHFTPFILY